MGVLRLRRRPPPALPLEVFGETWKQWLLDAAAAAACPVDYVVAPLLASVSTLIGNARWAQAWPGWSEPPHLWAVVVGDSGTGKSPGADCLMRDVLPTIERRMVGDYPDRLHEWQAAVEFDKIAKKRWKDEFREAQEKKKPLPPIPKPTAPDIAPEKPRLRQHDVTIEQTGAILATAAPKGVVMVRDEIAGWLMGMEAYNPAGRAFWLEAYGGRPYRVERRKHGAEPIEIERLAVAVYGGTQPERLSELATGPDDGLFSRILWLWPDPVPFRRGATTPNVDWAIEALDRLRELDLAPGNPPNPILMPLTARCTAVDGRIRRRDGGAPRSSRRIVAVGLRQGARRGATAVARARMALVLREGRHVLAAGQHIQGGLRRRRDAGRRVLHADGGARVWRRRRDRCRARRGHAYPVDPQGTPGRSACPNAASARFGCRGCDRPSRSRRPPTCWSRPIGCGRPPKPSLANRAAGSLTPSTLGYGGGDGAVARTVQDPDKQWDRRADRQ